MNREIKFRAWYKADLELGAPIKFTMDTKDDEIKFIATDEGFSFSYPFALVFTDDDFIIEQYTGLIDNNGVEIYGGDIVEFEDIVGEVQFLPQQNGYAVMTYNADYELECRKYSVIGNIHENEELLK